MYIEGWLCESKSGGHVKGPVNTPAEVNESIGLE